MADETVSMQSLGQPGEPCEQCGSPLAADQRYCLNCGRRRGAPRVDYRQQMLDPAAGGTPEQPSPSPQPEPAQAPASEPRRERDFAPLAAVGGIAVLGLMLLVGVLIGKGDSGGTVATPAPVVRVGGEVGSEAATGAEGSASEGGSKGAGLGTGSGSDGGKQSKSAAQNETDTGDAVQASEGELEELEGESGEDAAKNALKLPDKIATPGAPPPIDKSMPPGGGEGGAVTIK